MTHVAVFVVGPPGVGKTSAVRELLGSNFTNFTDPGNGKVKWCFQSGGPFVFAGHYGVGTFDGGDTVPNDGWLHCMSYWKENILPREEIQFTVFDGDRFSHGNCVQFLKDSGAKVLCIHLTASNEAMEERRRERGSDQNATWLAGRVSKAKNFANRFLPEDDSLFDMFGDGDAPEAPAAEPVLLEVVVEGITPTQVADQIRSFIGS